jgi:hypothetical protein
MNVDMDVYSSTLLKHPLCMHLDDLADLEEWLEEAPYV